MFVIINFMITILWQLLTVSQIQFLTLDLMLTWVFFLEVISSLLPSLSAHFDHEIGDKFDGECNHTISEASFNVPLTLQASPSGIVTSFWTVRLLSLWDILWVNPASHGHSVSIILVSGILYSRFPFLGASTQVFFFKVISSDWSLPLSLWARFDRKIADEFNGECNHTISEASFNVPSTLQASPSGIVTSFWMVRLPLLRDASRVNSASHMYIWVSILLLLYWFLE